MAVSILFPLKRFCIRRRPRHGFERSSFDAYLIPDTPDELDTPNSPDTPDTFDMPDMPDTPDTGYL